MIAPRYRSLAMAAAALAGIWLLAWAGHRLVGGTKMTAQKFAAYADKLDLSRLKGEERARALRELADKLNRLPAEERRRVRAGNGRPGRLFEQMTEQEKGEFIEATMPTGFKQMLSSFEQLPEDRRKRAIERAMGRLKEGRGGFDEPEGTTNRPPEVSPELQKQILTLGLKTFYKESSAQTKAEVAPLLEEIQRAMEGGRLFHP